MALCLPSPLVGCHVQHAPQHSQLLGLPVGQDGAHGGDGQATTIHESWSGRALAGRRRGLLWVLAVGCFFCWRMAVGGRRGMCGECCEQHSAAQHNRRRVWQCALAARQAAGEQSSGSCRSSTLRAGGPNWARCALSWVPRHALGLTATMMMIMMLQP